MYIENSVTQDNFEITRPNIHPHDRIFNLHLTIIKDSYNMRKGKNANKYNSLVVSKFVKYMYTVCLKHCIRGTFSFHRDHL